MKKKKNNGTRAYRFLRALLGGPVRFFNRIRVIGAENEPEADQSALVICNHLQWTDPIWLCAAFRWQQPHFMAKKELFQIPLVGKLVRALGAYPVNRGGADVGAVKRTIRMLEEGTTVGMFPQGHRRKNQSPRDTEIRPGAGMIAARANVPVLPVLIYTKGYCPRLFRRVYVVIGKPIPAEEILRKKEECGEYLGVTKYLFDRVCELETLVPEKR